MTSYGQVLLEYWWSIIYNRVLFSFLFHGPFTNISFPKCLLYFFISSANTTAGSYSSKRKANILFDRNRFFFQLKKEQFTQGIK